MTRRIPLTRDMVALIDDEDYERVSPLKWGAVKSAGSHWYARHAWSRKGKWGSISLHRFILDAPDGMHVDHINGDGLDNRRCNLRLATQAQNNRNTAPRTITGMYGVTRSVNGRGYLAFIRHDGGNTDLGWHKSLTEAARMYDAAVHLIGDDFHGRNYDQLFDASLEMVADILNGARPPREPRKLTDQDVIDIRRRYADGGVLMRELADEYDVTTGAINHAIGGHTFRHITDPAPIRTYKRKKAA
jgi:hypothetical protein